MWFHNITPSGNYVVSLMGVVDYNLNTYAKSVYRLYIYNGIYTNYSNIVSNRVDLYSGTIDFNGFNSTGALAFYNSGAKGTIYLRSGIFTFTASSGNIMYVGSLTTLYAGNSTIILSPTGQNNIIVEIGGKTYNKVQFSGTHTGNFDIAGNNTFAELIIDKGRKVRLTGGSNQTVTKMTALGTTAEPITLTSTNTTPATLTYTGTGYQQLHNMVVSYINAVSTYPQRWFAGRESTDGGSNTGWLFRDYISKAVVMYKKFYK